MKVVLLSFLFGEYVIRLANGLAQEIDVLLLLPENEYINHRSKLSSFVQVRPFYKPRLRNLVQQMRMIFWILHQIYDFSPDVIHYQNGHLWFNLFLPWLKRFPLVLTIHDVRHHLGDRAAAIIPQGIKDFGCCWANQIIIHGNQLKKDLVKHIGVSEEKIHVIPHIILGDNKNSGIIQEEEGLILFFGRIWEYKGLEYLIKAEPLITSCVSEARIVIAGCGENFERYSRLMVHPEKFIVYNEYISDEKRSELFQKAALVVLPYVEASQSGVIPLAYSYQKSVVVTQVGSLPEMVVDGITGFLVPPRNEIALADAIVRLLTNKPLRSNMGKNGKRKIHADCSEEVVANKTLLVYQKALSIEKQLA